MFVTATGMWLFRRVARGTLYLLRGPGLAYRRAADVLLRVRLGTETVTEQREVTEQVAAGPASPENLARGGIGAGFGGSSVARIQTACS